MKTILAYSVIVIGIPCFAGLFLGSIVAIPVGRLLLRSVENRTRCLLLLETFNGIAASVVGAILFRMFGLTPGLSVPILVAAWVTFYSFAYGQPFLGWLSWMTGIFLGWFTLAKLFLP